MHLVVRPGEAPFIDVFLSTCNVMQLRGVATWVCPGRDGSRLHCPLPCRPTREAAGVCVVMIMILSRRAV